MTDDRTLEQRAFHDLDQIAITARDGVADAEAGDLHAAHEALKAIRDRAEAWEDDG